MFMINLLAFFGFFVLLGAGWAAQWGVTELLTELSTALGG